MAFWASQVALLTSEGLFDTAAFDVSSFYHSTALGESCVFVLPGGIWFALLG